MHNVYTPFGPFIYRADIRGEFHDFLLEGVNDHRTAQSAGDYLVGNIDEQRIAPYDSDKFVGFIDEHIVNFIQEKHDRHNTFKNCCFVEEMPWDCKQSKISYDLGRGPWINYQQNGEFNPIHNHSGVISAVVFIDIPDEIEKERDNSHYMAQAAGCLEFIFGNQHMVVRPKSGYMYLFPSDLWHAVYPFKTDVQRITLSFNVYNLMVNNVETEVSHFSNYSLGCPKKGLKDS